MFFLFLALIEFVLAIGAYLISRPAKGHRRGQDDVTGFILSWLLVLAGCGSIAVFLK